MEEEMADCNEFNIDVNDIEETIKNLKSLLTEKGGTYSGDQCSGTFSGQTQLGIIRGKYTVNGSTVRIKILDRPRLIRCGRIEAAVMNFFS